MREIETNKIFNLVRCGQCSGWIFNVICDRTMTQGIITVSHCTTENEYTVVGQSLEENCPISDFQFPNTLELLVPFLTRHFSRIDENDPCYIFSIENVLCPTCDQDTLTL